MIYTVKIRKRAFKALEDLNEPVYTRIKNTILELAKDPRPAGCKKLVNRNGWRLRVGDYRVVYSIDDKIRNIEILDVGHRRFIYE